MKFSRRKFIKWFAFGVPVAMAFDAFIFERFFVETSRHILNDIAKSANKIYLLQVSDLHLQTFDYKAKLLVAKINRLKPNVILFTGDSIDKKENLSVLREFLGAIDKSVPKFSILGNWEYWGKVDINKLRQIYKENNCELLVNSSRQVWIKEKLISITGTDDFLGGNADIKKALEDYTSADYQIILNHCPEYNDFIDREISASVPVNLILSGHTHGGQVNIFGYIPFLPRGSGRFVKGWYKTERGFPVYVSKGIGTSMIPARFGARAEVAMFEL